MSHGAIVLKQTLPADAVGIGRLVLNLQDPSQDYYQPPISPTNISTQRLEKFTEILTRTRDKRLRAFFTTIFSSSVSAKNDQTTQVNSPICITRRLHNSTDYFRCLFQMPDVRRWIEHAIAQNSKPYMIVGLKTVIDATVTLKEGRSQEVAINAQAPMGIAAASAGLLLSGIVDPGLTASKMHGTGAKQEFFAPGEQVYAVQYRRIEFAWFLAKNLKRIWLETGNRWEIYLGSKGSRREHVADVMEVKLGVKTDRQTIGEGGEVVILGGEKLYFPGQSLQV